MLAILRRFLVVQMLLFWQGGFLFYAAVVVPIGTEVLGSAANQAWITRRVTSALNLAGVVTVALLAADIALGTDQLRRRRLQRWLVWGLLATSLIALALLHSHLDALMDPDERLIMHRPVFRVLHRWYLWISTFQWACGLAAVWLTLRAWQGEDRSAPTTNPDPRTSPTYSPALPAATPPAG
jgi:hypothetical protein